MLDSFKPKLNQVIEKGLGIASCTAQLLTESHTNVKIYLFLSVTTSLAIIVSIAVKKQERNCKNKTYFKRFFPKHIVYYRKG